MTSSNVIGRSQVVQTTLAYWLDPALGGDTEFVGGAVEQYRRKLDHQLAEVHDIRGREEEFGLDKQGFQLCKHSSVDKDFRSEERIRSTVYAEVEQLLKSVTGATKVHPFSHIIRRARPEFAKALAADPSVADGDSVQQVVPAPYVHIDQSEAGALSVLNDSFPAKDVSQLLKSRWSIINVWRPIKPVFRDPLGVCDAGSVADEDLMPVYVKLPKKGSATFENVTKGRGFELLQLKARPGYRWYYASSMTPEEVLMIKIYDSRADGSTARRVPHSAFSVPNTENEETRESIEVRCLVFYEDSPVECNQ